MNQEYIVLRGSGSLSALGASRAEVSRSYAAERAAVTAFSHEQGDVPVAALSGANQKLLSDFVDGHDSLAVLDRSVQLGCFASAKALDNAGWQDDVPVGVFIGSSRGATDTWEQSFTRFSSDPEKRLSARTSPTTTAGNLASSVARLFNLQGVHTSHSITCSTALHAVLNGVAWLQSGMIDRVLVGGTEAPLTAFTIAQMQALGIYADRIDVSWPCRPFACESKDSTFMLGEGAACFCLERVEEAELRSGDIVIAGYGFDTELTESFTAISKDGAVFQSTMRQALQYSSEPAQAVIAHAPGTRLGDAAELFAINAVFPESPLIVSNKFLAGHTFGASGALNLELAILLLNGMEFPVFPYETSGLPEQKSRVLDGPVVVNATGFGGNAVSIVLRKVK